MQPVHVLCSHTVVYSTTSVLHSLLWCTQQPVYCTVYCGLLNSQCTVQSQCGLHNNQCTVQSTVVYLTTNVLYNHNVVYITTSVLYNNTVVYLPTSLLYNHNVVYFSTNVMYSENAVNFTTNAQYNHTVVYFTTNAQYNHTVVYFTTSVLYYHAVVYSTAKFGKHVSFFRSWNFLCKIKFQMSKTFSFVKSHLPNWIVWQQLHDYIAIFILFLTPSPITIKGFMGILCRYRLDQDEDIFRVNLNRYSVLKRLLRPRLCVYVHMFSSLT